MKRTPRVDWTAPVIVLGMVLLVTAAWVLAGFGWALAAGGVSCLVAGIDGRS